MQTEIETISKWESGWTFRLRSAATIPPDHLIIFVHGWTGDEHSMQLFARQAPASAALVFPRGLIKAAPSGFGWTDHNTPDGTSFAQFASSAHKLMNFLESQAAELGLPTKPMTLVGFSQGAALSLTLMTLFPNRFNRLASLAGFLPHEIPLELAANFTAKKVYVAHGRNDRAIPVSEARRAVNFLENAGAEVNYCESNSGHKLSASCFKGLTEFLNAV